jgi:integrase/recombinase XerD
MTAPRPRSRQLKQLDAGIFQAEISSFRLHLAAEGKAAKTVRTYIEAVQWFAAAHLLEETRHSAWGQVDAQDVQRWLVWLLESYSDAYASNQYRGGGRSLRWRIQEPPLGAPAGF